MIMAKTPQAQALPKAVPLTDLQEIYKGALQAALTTIVGNYVLRYSQATASGNDTQYLTDAFQDQWNQFQQCDANMRAILGV
jgi:hypothetical protein